ncbi:MAG: hypothetical protein J6A89_07135 [Clostridia bacterium]|nr:hypothetical protein [Bacilli bacterium]MBO5349571.1 hypothetical protein [Clostridia bacterium]
MENNKHKAQIKYRKNNYKQFNIDFRFETFNTFAEICKKNNTTPTTEIKKFVEEYIKSNS